MDGYDKWKLASPWDDEGPLCPECDSGLDRDGECQACREETITCGHCPDCGAALDREYHEDERFLWCPKCENEYEDRAAPRCGAAVSQSIPF